jgi:hypothetical protein
MSKVPNGKPARCGRLRELRRRVIQTAPTSGDFNDRYQRSTAGRPQWDASKGARGATQDTASTPQKAVRGTVSL